jgi:hypothetical protein
VALKLDTANKPLVADGADLAIAYASIVDANGTIIPTAINPVTFKVSGPGKILSGDGNPTAAVAGIATVYVQTQYNIPGTIIVTATATGLCPGLDTLRSIAPPTDISTAARFSAVFTAQKRHGVSLVQYGNQIAVSVFAEPAGRAATPRLYLYTMQGRLVQSFAVRPGVKTLVSVNNYAPGIYFGKLSVGEEEYCLRIVSVRP